MKHWWLVGCLVCACMMQAQNIPVSMEYTRLYDFVDELATDGVAQICEGVRPYTRRQVAAVLVEAQQRDSLLNKRQKADLQFFLNEFSLERDTMRNGFVQYTDHQTFNLSLFDPQFSYMTRNKLFKMQVKPIIGGDLIANKKGAIVKRWYGVELQMDIAHHISIWGSLRDNSWNGKWMLRKKYFPTLYDKIDGAKLTKPGYLNNLAGVQYKEAEYGGDFSDSRGGISLYTWWGSIGLQRESIRWGDAYHCSNILSGRNPAVPMLTLQLTPVWWFQFDYFHAWLVSNVLDPNSWYVERTVKDGEIGSIQRLRPQPKYMAANMFTFMPCKWVHFGFGNSIVYAENNVQPAYFIPFAFYKSLDHLLTKGTSTENQNSQIFFTLTVRPVEHLKLYSSVYVDEIKWKRFKRSEKEKNPISYLVGFDWSGWPVRGLSLKGEFMRSYIACYTHSVEALEFTSNGYIMGHYMGDNAQSIFVELSYRPVRGLQVGLSYTGDTRYNMYKYLRSDIGNAIAQKPFDKKIWTNHQIDATVTYEVIPNLYIRGIFSYNHAKGYNRQTVNCASEVTATAQEFLNRFTPVFYQGRNITATIGVSYGF